MNIYIFDLEVFKHDWVFVAKSIDRPDEDHVVIHNDNHALKKFLLTDPFLGGFNNKHYDDGIIHAIYHGADNATVKKLNDHIIVKRKMWWEFPFLQFKKREFKSFDLRDDTPINLSLKAIEGHLGQSIVETGVDFNIDRKLTKEELEMTIDYCKTDVNNTIRLYDERQNYLNSKKAVARLKGMDEKEAMSMTNAKLTAAFLDAKKTEYSDELEYTPPEELQIGKYTHVLDFFMDPVQYTINDLYTQMATEERKVRIRSLERRIEKIQKLGRYECNLETDIAGVPHVYAWGGIHGARPKFYIQAEEDYKIVIIDVGSYYPSQMLEYNYISRSVASAEWYERVYKMRMGAKKNGNKETSNALKLVLNTCYGAMKNQYNDLFDPRNASAICITGQLLLTDLIDKLESVEGFELIQSNTDGLVIRFPIKSEGAIVSTVTKWEKRTRMGMEYTEVHALAQKDVNNYVMKVGEVYYYENGRKIIEKKDYGNLELKGGYVSLAKGGNYQNNSLVAVHKALVSYLMDGVSIEDSINGNDNVFEFQNIAKTGGTYDGTYHEVDGKKVDVQKVNRVYATKDKRYGTLYKVKKNGNADKIANLPDHCIIDNEATITIDQIDKDFYIDMATKRVREYIGNQKITIKKTKKSEEPLMAEMNIYKKIMSVRMAWLDANVQKTGINRFAEYKYFELADIVPVIMPLFDTFNLYPHFSFTEEVATMDIIDIDNPANKVTFSSPMRKLAVKGMNEIQALGGVETYQRRYLYMMLLDIVEQDAFDGSNGQSDDELETPNDNVTAIKPKTAAKSNRPSTPKQRAEVKKDLVDENGQATDIQIKSIKNGLKKLRAASDDNEPYIKEVVLKIKDGISKSDAEDMLIEIGKKVEGA